MPHRPASVQSPFAAIGREKMLGKVFLVGAGPGDPGLITVRGSECLRTADVVLYDGLASEELLELADSAECISVGKHGQVPLWTQADINLKIVEMARQGKRVVRLKGGDPAVFARTAEELAVLSEAEIPFEVVPGITAALAAASYVGIPITHRHHASAVALITGQQQAEHPPQPIDWDALARFPGTIVFYMGVTTVEEWTAKLVAAGKSAQTPAAIIRRCTWSDQTVVRCTLGEVAAELTPASKMRPPVIVIVGAVAALGEDFDWFSARPLHGCGILVTRATHQSQEMVRALRELGAEVHHQPVLTIHPPTDTTSLDAAVDFLSRKRYHGVTFSSSNGVDGLLEPIFAAGHDARIFADVRLAAVGLATAERLQKFGLRCDILPTKGNEQSAQGLLATLSSSVRGERWLVTTTNRSSGVLQKTLREQGADVDECLAYETRPVTELRPGVVAALHAGRLHFATITSTAIAEAAFELLDGYRDYLRPVSLSHAGAERLAQLGWPAAAVADEHSSVAVCRAIQVAWQQRSLS